MQSGKHSHPRGFTVVELIVAISILAIILTATSVIWSSQQKVMQISAAQGEVSPYARAIESNLRRDLQGLARDGFMVIRRNVQSYSANPPTGEVAYTYSYDQLLFFSNGLKSAVSPAGGATLTSRVWYGHLITTDWGSNAVNPNTAIPSWKFSLGRQDLLLQPGSTGGVASIYDSAISDGTADVVNTDLIAIKQGIYSNPTPPNPANAMSNACFRIKGQRYADPGVISGAQGIMPIHALLAPFCSNFNVQFAGRYDTANTPVGQVDVDSNGQIVWYGNVNVNGPVTTPPNFPVANIVNGDTFIFPPDRPDLWPALLQITVDLHDSNGRLHERFKNLVKNTSTTSPTDGYQYRFVIKL